MHDLKPLFSRRIFRDCLDFLLPRGKLRGFMITTMSILYGTSNTFGIVAATISDSVLLMVRLIIYDWQTIGWALRSRREMLFTISFSRATLKNNLRCRASCIQTKTEASHFNFELSNTQYYSKTQRCKREA